MGSAGIFPFYCHFALLILYHWRCCLHCSRLAGLKKIYCAQRLKLEQKRDEIQKWFSWTVRMLRCDGAWLRAWSSVAFCCSLVQLWLCLTMTCTWMCLHQNTCKQVCTCRWAHGVLRSCIYSHVNIFVLWMCDSAWAKVGTGSLAPSLTETYQLIWLLHVLDPDLQLLLLVVEASVDFFF